MSKAVFDFPGGKSSSILVVDNLLEKDVCHNLINECIKNYEKFFSPGPTLGGIDLSTKSSMDMNFSRAVVRDAGVDEELFASYEDAVTSALSSAISFYQKTYSELWHWPGIQDTGYRIQHYEKNFGFYRQHIDGCPWGHPDSVNRVLGVVIYLNDIENGGETYFPIHDISVEPLAGRMCLFPAYWTHPHQGNPAYSCDKWIISTFITCEMAKYKDEVEEKD